MNIPNWLIELARKLVLGVQRVNPFDYISYTYRYVRYVYNCVQFAMLIKMITNNPSRKSVVAKFTASQQHSGKPNLF